MNRKKSILLLFLFLSCVSLGAFAQNNTMRQVATSANDQTVTGTVVDDMGEPVIGATVKAQGATGGTITDVDGNFAIDAPQGTMLSISYVGYKTVTVAAIGGKLNVRLQPTATDLGEVVVTALGIKRSAKALSYNVQQVGGSSLTDVPDGNLMNSLSGKVAGVNINTSSSGVGGAAKVVMRGNKSISSSSNALYVIDGIPMYNFGAGGGTEFDSTGSSESIADLNPDDIESMSVLTGAAAAALYGSSGANGAIVITTKKGKEGKVALTVSQNTEFLSPLVMPQFQTRYGTGDLMSSAQVVDKSWGSPQALYNYSPQNDYFQRGMATTESVTLSTGTKDNQTFASASALNSKGLVPNNGYNRYNFTIRNTSTFLNDKMTLDLGFSYIKQTDRNMTNQGVYSNPLVEAYLFPRGDDWQDIRMYERWDPTRNISTQYWNQGMNEYTGQNPYWINFRNTRTNNKDRYMANAGLTYKVLDWLTLMARIRIDNASNDYEEKFYATTNLTLAQGSNNGLYGITHTDDRQIYGDALANFDKDFTNGIGIHGTLGVSFQTTKEDVLHNRGPIGDNMIPNVFITNQIDDTRFEHTQTGWEEQTRSLFASAELSYKSAYYLTLTGRNDWPSQLAGPYSKQTSFFYPSVGTSFVLSDIFKLPKFVTYAKLRGSWASVGMPFPRFLAQPVYLWDTATKSWAGAMTNYPMSNLKPENTNSWEIGLNAILFNDFKFDLTLYSALTYNQTFDAQISASSAYSTLYVQSGKVRNQGIEASLGYSHKWGDFAWNSTYTFSANQNKIQEIVANYVNPVNGALLNIDQLEVGRINLARYILKVGGSLGDLYSSSELMRDQNGYIYVTPDGKVTPQSATEPIKLGSVFPKSNMAWSNSFSYKNLSLSFLIAARFGGIVYSATQAAMDNYGVSKASADARDAGGVWVNGTDRIPAQNWYTAIGANGGIPQYYTYSATNIRLQEARIAYTFPRRTLLNIADVTLSLIGRNLFMIYNKAPFDPEAVASTGNYYQGVDYFMMPSTRNIGFNVQIKF